MLDENQIVEDVEEKDLLENQELEAEETLEEVSEEIEVAEDTQNLSDSVLDILLGESKEKSEEEDEEEESDEDEELEEDAHEDEDEEVDEDAHEDEDEDEDEVELPEVKTKAGILAASFDALKGMKKSELVAAYEAINMTEEEDEVEVPKTKADIINAMYGQLKAMKKDDIMASYKSIMASNCGTHREETEADLFADDLSVLAEADQNLTDDFKSKAAILFEGAVANRIAEIKEDLEAQYSNDLQEEVTYIRESLVTKIDDYMSYVVESWIEENQEFVDNKLRTEITEDFMKALQGVFTEHYIEVPDSKVDLVDELSDEVVSMKESLAASEANANSLAEEVEKLNREKIVTEACSDLASTQSAKLNSLIEEVEYVDAKAFAAKVATIKESFFNDSSSEEEVINESNDSKTKTIVEGEIDRTAKISSDMQRYVSTLSRFK